MVKLSDCRNDRKSFGLSLIGISDVLQDLADVRRLERPVNHRGGESVEVRVLFFFDKTCYRETYEKSFRYLAYRVRGGANPRNMSPVGNQKQN